MRLDDLRALQALGTVAAIDKPRRRRWRDPQVIATGEPIDDLDGLKPKWVRNHGFLLAAEGLEPGRLAGGLPREDEGLWAIELTGSAVDATDLQASARLSELRALILQRTTLPAGEIGPDQTLRPLRELTIVGVDEPGGLLGMVRGCRHLWSVEIGASRLGPGWEAVLATWPRLTRLSVWQAGLTDAALVAAGGAPRLTRLRLEGSALTGPGCAPLANLRDLRHLELAGPKIGDEVGGALADLLELRNLSLRGTGVGDGGLERIGRLRRLDCLDLSGTATGDAGLEMLAKLRKLEVLRLRGTAVGDAGLATLTSHERLHELDLAGTRVTSAGVAALGGLGRLEVLDLSGTAVDDDAIGALAAMRRLRLLDLSRTLVSDAGVGRLVDALPKCVVASSPSGRPEQAVPRAEPRPVTGAAPIQPAPPA